MSAINELKKASGIDSANCKTCFYLGTEGDGHEYNGSWPVCEFKDSYSNLKSFPFTKDMECWRPDFWHSKFTDGIKTGSDKEVGKACDRFKVAIDGVLK